MMSALAHHETAFDNKEFDKLGPYYADGVTYIKGSGAVVTGRAAVLAALQDDYSLFTHHFHEPVYGVVTDTTDGYRLFGYARVFINLPGAGERKFQDNQGRLWEAVSQGAFLFDVVKDPTGPGGLKFTHYQIFADPTPVLGSAVRKGILPAEIITTL